MVVAGTSRQLFKTGNLSFSKNFPLGQTVFNITYKNYSSVCLNTVVEKTVPFMRLWCGCRRLLFTKETTRSPLAKLTPQELTEVCLAEDVEPVASNRAFLETSGLIRRILTALQRAMTKPLSVANDFVQKNLDRIIYYVNASTTFTENFISVIDFLAVTLPQVFDPPPKGRLYYYGVRFLTGVKIILVTITNALKAVPNVIFARPLDIINKVFEFILKYIPAGV